MKSRRPAAHDLGLFLLGMFLPALLTACDTPRDDSPPPSAQIDPDDVPSPDTSDSEPRVRSVIAAARGRVLEQPNSADAWGRLGNVLFPHDMFDEALAAYRHAQQLDPGRFEWMYMLAVTLELRAAGSEESLEWFGRALALRPQDPAIHLRIGEGLARRGRHDEALAAFNRASELVPDDPFPLRRIGETLLLTGRPEEARATLERCRRLAPNAREPVFALLQVLTQLEEDDAADQLEAQLDRLAVDTIVLRDNTVAQVMAHGVSSGLLFPRAVALAGEQRFTDALRLFRICEEVHPESPRLHAWIGSCLVALGDHVAARSHLERALRNFPEEYRALITLAQIEFQIDNVDRAQVLLERARDANPDNGPAYAMLGLVAARRGNHIEAVRLYRQAEDRAPLSARDLYNLAEVHVALQEIPDAGRRLEQSIQRDPRYIPPRIRLGELLERIGRRPEARAQYAEVLRIDPGHAVALERFRAMPAD